MRVAFLIAMIFTPATACSQAPATHPTTTFTYECPKGAQCSATCSANDKLLFNSGQASSLVIRAGERVTAITVTEGQPAVTHDVVVFGPNGFCQTSRMILK